MWDEPPRLRKQVATLLLEHGHEIHFFQKRKFGRRAKSEEISDRLTIHTSAHLLNHQLKIFQPLNAIDAAFLKRIFRQQVDIRTDDVILNFCYDLDFLRDLYPNNRMLHIVNDDYIAMALTPHKRSAARLLKRNCQAANHTFTVSLMVEEYLREYTDNISLFFPWARSIYRQPNVGLSRNEIMYWGYINERIDFDVVGEILDAGIKINFFGYITPSNKVSEMLSHPNAEYHGIADLQDVPEVLERCCCSLLPYNPRDETIRCITINNRGFELLSFGLPLLYTALPYLIPSPDNVIYKCHGAEKFLAAYEDARRNFDAVQPVIEHFLQSHTSEMRYRQIMEVLADDTSAVQSALLNFRKM